MPERLGGLIALAVLFSLFSLAPPFSVLWWIMVVPVTACALLLAYGVVRPGA